MHSAGAVRLRPILMSTFTTVFGLAPLVLIPGAGTELYRGVGIVVLAGLVCSTIIRLPGWVGPGADGSTEKADGRRASRDGQP